jgi:hypothetical protein
MILAVTPAHIGFCWQQGIRAFYKKSTIRHHHQTDYKQGKTIAQIVIVQ